MAIASWQESGNKPRQSVEKQRHYSADKSLHSQDYGLPGSMYTMGCYSPIRKNEITPFAATWNLEIIILSEASQTEKEKYHMILLIYGILKN